MTSAVMFSREHVSLWAALAPTTDMFVRRLNAELYVREFVPLKSDIQASRRAFVNEVAFSLFCSSQIDGRPRPSEEKIRQAVVLVQRQSSLYTYAAVEDRMPDAAETDELLNLLERLQRFFWRVCAGKEIEYSPRFVGCGFLDTCAGDLRCGETLFEIKAGDRSFRSVDIRQLLIYAALNKSAEERPLKKIGLFNPRTGVSFVGDLDFVSAEISGRPAVELLNEIVRVISSGDMSR